MNLPGAGPSSTRGSAEPVPLLVLEFFGVQSQYNDSIVVIVNRRETGLIVGLVRDCNSERGSGDTVDGKLANEIRTVAAKDSTGGQNRPVRSEPICFMGYLVRLGVAQ